ncbi:MAG: ABC transporter permease [Tannerella sp.]|jgi:ABC-2 type transport system permease protein|nr:ABC transporter permease [Tannerella sp.]
MTDNKNTPHLLRSFIRKEFCHILRDPLSLLIMFLLPIMLMMILGFAVSTEIRHIPFVAMDMAKSQESRELIEKLNANACFDLQDNVHTAREVEAAFQKGLCAMAVVIPAGFGSEPLRSGVADIQVMTDASDPNQASTMVNYFQAEILAYQQAKNKAAGMSPAIVTDVKMLYNPQLRSALSIVPGLLGMVLMLICAMMTSIAVVREKELGTMEILLVSPLRPQTVIFAKVIPYLTVSIANVALILALANVALDVPVNGNILLLATLSLLYIFTALSMGLLISTIAATQQTAMVAVGVGLMLPTMLLSGMIFPIDSMPAALQVISHAVPARWFVEALRNVMIRGLGFDAVWRPFFILLGMCIFFMTVSIKKFRNRL